MHVVFFHNDLVENRFKQTGKIKSNEWNSGNNLWLIEIVSIKNTFKMMTQPQQLEP